MRTSNWYVVMLSLGLLASFACGQKEKQKGDSSDRQRADSGSSPEVPKPNSTKFKVGGLIRNSLNINGRAGHTHLLFVFETNRTNSKVISAQLNGKAIKSASSLLGDARQFKSDIISAQTVAGLSLTSGNDSDEAAKSQLVSQYPGQPFYYVEGFSKDLGAVGEIFKFQFTLSDGANEIATIDDFIDNSVESDFSSGND